MKKYSSYISTPVGDLCLVCNDKYLLSVSYTDFVQESDTHPILDTTQNQLFEFFNGTRKIFSIPLKLKGTEFQEKVWRELQNIPYGDTISYKELAEKIGNPKSCRAVGNANNKNPFSIIIPCHRVIGSNNKLVGYAGGLDKKEWLLAHENIHK